tara:strand:- start:258 stop:680 length:423 start_codon:yes stop_codon:yes gene_type:complete
MIKKLRFFTMILSVVFLIFAIAFAYFFSESVGIYIISGFVFFLGVCVVVEFLAHKQRAKIKKLHVFKNQHLEQLKKVHGFGGIYVDERKMEFVVGIDTDSIDNSTADEFKKATQNIQQILGAEWEIRFTYKRDNAFFQDS